MNPSTLIVVRCHAGDRDRVMAHLPMWKHHECPILFLSPADSPVEIDDPQVFDCRHFGKSEYGGHATIAREHGYLVEMSKCPFDFFFVCDSDCYSLDAELPKCLYQSREIVWATLQSDETYPRPEYYPFPRWAFQTPWFIPREVLPRLLAEGPRTMFVPQAPWGDNYLMQLAALSDTEYRQLPNSISCCIVEQVPEHLAAGEDFVRNRGGVFVHAVKELKITQRLIEHRKQYLLEHSNPGKE